MSGRGIGVACLIPVLLAFSSACTDAGAPNLPAADGDGGAANVSPEPPAAESGGASDDSEAGAPSAGKRTPTVIRSSPPTSSDGFSFAGCWDSPEWGWMRLESDGVTVSGAYEHDDGRIDGLGQGSTVSGTWSEDPSYAPPDDAGQFEFTLSDDGQSFAGNWRYGYEGNWDGSWTAVRVECEPSTPTEAVLQWPTTWDTDFGRMELEFAGELVTGQYDHDEGRIDGIVSGPVITGTWSEAPGYAPPSDAGQFEFMLSEDGRSFTGRWRYGSDGEWRSWSGTALN